MYVNTNKKNNGFLIIFILLIFMVFSCISSSCSIAPIIYCMIDEDNCEEFKSKIEELIGWDLVDTEFADPVHTQFADPVHTNTECQDLAFAQVICNNLITLTENGRNSICNGRIGGRWGDDPIKTICPASCNTCDEPHYVCLVPGGCVGPDQPPPILITP